MARLIDRTGWGFLALAIAASPLSAQTPGGWSPISTAAMGTGSAACTPKGSQGDMFCFGLRCAATGEPEWFTHQVGGDSVEGDVRVNLVFDGRGHTTLQMKQVTMPSGEWSFSVPFDPARHRSSVESLETGSSVYVLIGGASGAALSLSGSARQIERVLAMCDGSGGAALQAQADEPSAEAASQPYDAVVAMAAKQKCEATEGEIFTAITEAGFGVWDANQFVVNGSKNGTLYLLDRAALRYRIDGCIVEKTALAVDPDVSKLALAEDQLPPAVREQLREIADLCGDAFTADTRGKDAFLAEDIDQDGTYDFLLEHAQFCPSQSFTLCGASNCPYTLIVSNGGQWRTFDYVLPGYKGFTEAGFLFQCDEPGRKSGVFLENGTLTERACK